MSQGEKKEASTGGRYRVLIKKFIDRNLVSIGLGDQQGELSCPAALAEPNRKKRDSSSFLANENCGLFVYPSEVFIKAFSFPCLHGAHHGCRPQIALLC